MREHPPLSLGLARASKSTDKALLVKLADEPKPRWIPQDCIHDDSDVFEAGQSGKLVIKAGSWWARQNGYD